MTRKHFELIAAAVAAAHTDPGAREQVAYQLAQALASTNPQFDRARFIAACMKNSALANA